MIEKCNQIHKNKCYNWNHEGQWLLSRQSNISTFLQLGKMITLPNYNFTTNEKDILINDLISQWSVYWNMNSPIIIEKSPQSMLKISFLYNLLNNHFNLKFLIIIKVNLYFYF